MRLTFLFVILLLSFPAQAQPLPFRKIAPALEQKILSSSEDSVWVSASIKAGPLQEEIKRLYRVENVLHHNIIKIRMALKDIPSLAGKQGVLFVSEILQPKEELTTGAYDLTLNRVNYTHTHFPFLNGNGLKVSVKERLFDPTDIDLLNRIFITGQESTSLTPHAALMATMIAGGANSSPFAKGIAWKAGITSSSFDLLFPDPGFVFTQHGIAVQNHSYGTIIENFYGNEAMAYDQQVNELPGLVHVFSSGNSGNQAGTSGIYAGISGSANLTGNFKQAKNVITVGSVDSSGSLMPLSSRGPSFDGRIKPELVAYGEDGSSGAAATVSGSVILLQQAFREMYDSLPPYSLVKAVLVNSADDAGAPHPDYKTGFGQLNTYRAVNTIMQNRFALGRIEQADTLVFPVVISNDISRFRVSLCWNDPATVAGAEKTLVNQLDLLLISEDGSMTWLPWVLDPSPSALQSTASRKRDTLNTVEQITIDAPPPGNYEVRVIGSALSASQDFAIAWQEDTSRHFYWTYPSLDESLISNNTHWLRWTTNRNEAANIEYQNQAGDWIAAGLVNDVSIGYFKWPVPDSVIFTRLRMQFNDSIIYSEKFTVSPQANVQVGFNCADSFLLYWDQIHTGSYEVYRLGQEYLEPFIQTTDTFLLLDKQNHPSIYYAVAPVIQGRPGVKANTVNYPSLSPSCYINAFYLQSQSGNVASMMIELGTIYGISELAIEKRNALGFSVIQTLGQPGTTSFPWDIPGLEAGENYYRLRIRTVDGRYVYSNVEVVYYWAGDPVMIYPNPVKRGETMKLLANESGRFTVMVTDANGRLLQRQLLNQTRTEIATAHLAAGIYLIIIHDREGKRWGRKVVVLD